MFGKIRPVMCALSAKTRLLASNPKDRKCFLQAQHLLQQGADVRNDLIQHQRALIQCGDVEHRNGLDDVFDKLIDEINANKR